MRTEGQFFNMDSLKFSAVWAKIRNDMPELDKDDAVDFVLGTDWPEGEEHQAWLDNSLTAPEEIADWAIIGLRGVIAERQRQTEEEAEMNRINSL